MAPRTRRAFHAETILGYLVLLTMALAITFFTHI